MFDSSNYGIIRTNSAGITVSRGTSGTIRFGVTVKAITGIKLSDFDQEFVQELSAYQKSVYVAQKTEYAGGLRVPFLAFLGADLTTRVTETDFVSARARIDNYEALSSVARGTLRSTNLKTYHIRGRRFLTGKSFVPETVYAFIKASRVCVGGLEMLVISSRAEDVVIANGRGVVFTTGADQLFVRET